MNENTLKEELNKAIIHEINFLRKDPQTYASKIRKYIRFFKREVLMLPGMPPIMTIEGSRAFEEAADHLDNLDPLPVLRHNSHLSEISTDVLGDILTISELENLNNINIDKHIEKRGKVVGMFSQALDFGSCNPELVVMNLLVDDGDSNRANRQTLLNPKFKIIGVCSGSHSQFLYCTVVTLARHFFELGKEVGELSDENYEENSGKHENFIRNFGQTCEKVKEFEGKVKNMCIDIEDKDYDEEIEIPEEIVKVEKNEKIIEENGVRKKVRKIKRFKEDGVIETEIFKEVIENK